MRLLTLMSLLGAAVAHMQMSNPPPLRSKFNTYTTSIDYDMVSPLHADGSNFPCKGYLSDLGTSQGAAVATWTAGSSQSATIVGGTLHNGGSCQFSLSMDGGATFKVLKSYIGNCPSSDGATYDFDIPDDVASSDAAIFAWSWFNQLGNREMYMNCAVVAIDGGSSSLGSSISPSTSSGDLSDRPDMFEANIGNGCTTVDSADVMFPNPGPYVDLENPGAVFPTGSGCGSGSGATGSSPAPPSTYPPSHPSHPSTDGGGGGGQDGHDHDHSGDDGGGRGHVSGGHAGDASASQAGTGAAETGADAAHQSWSPGNDWPDWFNAATIKPADALRHSMAVFVFALAMGIML